LALAALAGGCSDDLGIELAEGGGTVTWQGAPLAGANVTFVPAKGPVAVATTDNMGKFSLTTAGRKGVAVGECRVSVSVSESNADELAGKSDSEKMMELTKMMGQNVGKTGEDKKKSLVPERFANAETSGLQVTVSSNSAENNFQLDLTP
jgi:hypothetical protein